MTPRLGPLFADGARRERRENQPFNRALVSPWFLAIPPESTWLGQSMGNGFCRA
jgi:hypothetical protein